MEFLIPFLLLLFVFNSSPTWATNVTSSPFKGVVCNKCQQWCEPDVNTMTLIEDIINRKIKEAHQMRSVSICHGAKLESAIASDDVGGIFESYIPAIGFKEVFCDLDDDGGNWTRRLNGDVDFFRGWADYVEGFGDMRGDFWLGLEAMYQMTKSGNTELKIIMITKDGNYRIAKYSEFRIGPGSENYRLTVSGFSGNTTNDSFSYQNHQKFSTKDADHDWWPKGKCASYLEGGWWYNRCGRSNLNGNFNKADRKGMWWGGSSNGLLRYSEMKFRKIF